MTRTYRFLYNAAYAAALGGIPVAHAFSLSGVPLTVTFVVMARGFGFLAGVEYGQADYRRYLQSLPAGEDTGRGRDLA